MDVRVEYKESWAPKNWCIWTVVLEKTLESPLDCKEIQPVNPKDQTWIYIGRTDPEAEAPIFWPPNVKSRVTGKDPDSGKDWGQEKAATEGELVGWYHWLNEHEFEQTGDSEEQGSQACYSPWGPKESDRNEQLNNKKWPLKIKSGHLFLNCLHGLSLEIRWKMFSLWALLLYFYHVPDCFMS